MKYEWICPKCKETRLLGANPKYYDNNNERKCRSCALGPRGPIKQDSKWLTDAVRTSTQVAELLDISKPTVAVNEKRAMNKILTTISKETGHPSLEVGNRTCHVRKALQRFLMEYYIEEREDGQTPTEFETVKETVNTFKNTKVTRQHRKI